MPLRMEMDKNGYTRKSTAIKVTSHDKINGKLSSLPACSVYIKKTMRYLFAPLSVSVLYVCFYCRIRMTITARNQLIKFMVKSAHILHRSTFSIKNAGKVQPRYKESLKNNFYIKIFPPLKHKII